jgi:hypothetical protein
MYGIVHSPMVGSGESGRMYGVADSHMGPREADRLAHRGDIDKDCRAVVVHSASLGGLSMLILSSSCVDMRSGPRILFSWRA